MIAALLHGKTPVMVDGTQNYAGRKFANLQTISKDDHIGMGYNGGVGYAPSRINTLPAEMLTAAKIIDPDECDALRNWLDAMADVDNLADEQNPATAAALVVEDQARAAFIEFLQAQ